MSKKMTPNQKKYCRLRAEQTLPMVECYMQAYPRAKKTTAATQYQILEKKPEIQAEIRRLEKLTEDSSTLSRMEKRQFLARVVRTPLAKIDPEDPEDPNADLIESVTKTEHYSKEGDLVSTKFVVKLPGKLGSVEIDNKMSGHNEPEQHEHTVNGGVMLVPVGGKTLDEWEKEALEQQAEESLKGDEK